MGQKCDRSAASRSGIRKVENLVLLGCKPSHSCEPQTSGESIATCLVVGYSWC